MKDGWKTEPIYSMRKVGITEQCDSAEDEVSGFQFDWPGTEAGCYCEGDDSFTFKIYKQACSYSQLSGGCEQIPQMASQRIDYWSETENYTRLCVKRIRNWNFWDNPGDFYATECPVGKTLCTPTNSSSSGVTFCIPSEFGCPYTQMAYGEQIDSASDQKIFTTTNESVSSQNTKYIVLSKFVNKFPLISLAISEGDGVCLNPKLKNLTPKREDYSLLVRKRGGCGGRTDSQYQKLYSVGEIGLFSGLTEYSTIRSSLIGYDLNDQYKYGYYFKTQTYYTSKCIEGEYLQGVKDYDYRTKSVQAFFIINLITTLFFCIVILYTLWIERETVDLILYDEEQILAYYVFSSRKLNKRIYGVTLFSFIFTMVLFILTLRLLSVSYFNSLYSCMDETTVTLMNDLYYDQMKKYGIEVIFLFTIFMIFPIVRAVLQCYSWRPNEITEKILERAQIELDFFNKINYNSPVKQVFLSDKPNQVVQDPTAGAQLKEEDLQKHEEEDLVEIQDEEDPKKKDIKLPEFNPHNQKEARLLYIENEIFRLQENIKRIKSQKSNQKVITSINEEIKALQREEIKIKEEIRLYNEQQEKSKLEQAQPKTDLELNPISEQDILKTPNEQPLNLEQNDHSRNPSQTQLKESTQK